MSNVESPQDGTTSTFTFDRRTLDALDYLKAQIGATSRAEVIRRALALLDMAVEQADEKRVTIQTRTGPLQIEL